MIQLWKLEAYPDPKHKNSWRFALQRNARRKDYFQMVRIESYPDGDGLELLDQNATVDFVYHVADTSFYSEDTTSFRTVVNVNQYTKHLKNLSSEDAKTMSNKAFGEIITIPGSLYKPNQFHIIKIDPKQ